MLPPGSYTHDDLRLRVSPLGDMDQQTQDAFAGASDEAQLVEGDGSLVAIMDPDEDTGMIHVDLLDEEGSTVPMLFTNETDALSVLGLVLWQKATL